MTTQREPDTSAEGYRCPVCGIAGHVCVSGPPTFDELYALGKAGRRLVAALADAAGQAAPVPPPVEGLETTEEERNDYAHVFRDPEDQQMFAARFHRDFGRLAKEVDRLTTRCLALEQRNDDQRHAAGRAATELGNLRQKLAVYEAPIDDGEVERLREQCDEALGALDKEIYDQHRSHHFDPPNDADYTVSFGALAKAEKALNAVYFALGRLSAAHAECKGENERLQRRVDDLKSALDRATERVRKERNDVFHIAGTMEFGLRRTQLEGVSGELDHLGEDLARAAIAPASGEKAT